MIMPDITSPRVEELLTLGEFLSNITFQPKNVQITKNEKFDILRTLISVFTIGFSASKPRDLTTSD